MKETSRRYLLGPASSSLRPSRLAQRTTGWSGRLGAKHLCLEK